ncbi:hypothetical protein [Cytobacillus sp. NCCP-133]|nr:hypothetical protein [Cytobacillus sp. NCCP-133]
MLKNESAFFSCCGLFKGADSMCIGSGNPQEAATKVGQRKKVAMKRS